MIYYLYSIRDRFGVWRPVFSGRDDREIKDALKGAFKDGIPGDLVGSEVYCCARFDIVDRDEPIKKKELTFVGLLEDFVEVSKDGD